MATKTNRCSSGEKASRYALRLTLTQGTQTDTNKKNNQSPVTYKLELGGAKYFGLSVDYENSSFTGYTCNGILTFKNAKTNTTLATKTGSASGKVSSTSAITIASGSVTLPHNDDGTLTINVSAEFSGGLSTQTNGGSVSCSLTLTTIARATSLTEQIIYIGNADNVVSLNPKDSSFYHKLTFSCGNETFEGQGNKEITFDLSDEKYYDMFTGAEQKVTGTLETYSSDSYTTQIGSDQTGDITIKTQEALCKPTVTYQSDTDTNSVTSSMSDKYIKGYSDCKITISCETPHSEIDYITLNGKQVSFIQEGSYYTYTITGVSNTDNKIKVVSKRGYSSEELPITLDILDYIAPSFKQGNFKRNTPTDGILNLTYEGEAYTGKFNDTANALTFELDWNDGTNTGTIPLTATLGENTFSQTTSLSDLENGLFNYQKNYQFTLKVTDTLRTNLGLNPVVITGSITRGTPSYWWNSSKFVSLVDFFVKDRNILEEMGDLTSLSTTDKTSLVNAINEVNSVNAITISLSANTTHTVSAAWGGATIKYNTTKFKSGNKLTFANNKITIGAGVKKVKVSANTMVNGVANTLFSYIQYNGTTIANGYYLASNTSAYDTISLSPIFLNVKEGDVINGAVGCAVAGNLTVAGNNFSYLTVEVVE